MSRPLEASYLVPGRDAEVLGGLPQSVVDTITSARFPSTRRLYALKWNLFVDWCSSHREDPRRCPVRVVLSFLQEGLEHRLSPSTLKVYVAAIAAHHDAVDGKSLGKHDLVVRFLRGARRLNPPRPTSVPSWDLSLVLMALQRPPFGVSRVENSVIKDSSPDGIGFHQEGGGPAGIFGRRIVPRIRAGQLSHCPETPAWICAQGSYHSLQGPGSEPASTALGGGRPSPSFSLSRPCSAAVRGQSFRTSDQLFVCYGGQQKGKAVSKQRLAHWIVDAIVLAYQSQDVPCPFGLRAHSTRGVASSWAVAQGASLTDICRAAGWATPNTFARFYSLRVEPVSSRVLAPRGQ